MTARGEAGPEKAARIWLRRLRIAAAERLGTGAFALSPLPPEAAASIAPGPQILVVCHDVVRRGGLLRFARFGRTLAARGGNVSLVSLVGDPRVEADLGLPLLSLEAAARQRWDAVMIPGAGFPDALFPRLATFRDPRFGLRVQHVLNDRSRLPRFLDVNRVVAPHLVVFNTPDWTPDSWRDFRAGRFAVLCGAVDTAAFRPDGSRRHPLQAGRWVVGGLASKNPAPLVAALERLGPGTGLRLFGPDIHGLAASAAALVKTGRLDLVGPLDEGALPAFYRSVDCVVATETGAGWANLAAEAMASGVPVVCTKAGSLAFARPGENALVLDEPGPAAIAAAVTRLRGEPGLAEALSEAGERSMADFSWEAYTTALVGLIDGDQPT
jgi:glycosyltransferase involved in cell wall biosynthesis